MPTLQNIPYEAFFTLNVLLNKSSETSEEITSEVVEIMNRCWHLAIFLKKKQLNFKKLIKMILIYGKMQKKLKIYF